MRRTGCLCAFVAALGSLPACEAGESDASRAGAVDVPGLSAGEQGAPPAPAPASMAIQAAGSGASSSEPPLPTAGGAGAGGSDPNPAPAEEPVEPAPVEPAPAEPAPQDAPPPQMDEEPAPAQGAFGGFFGAVVDADTFCAKYELHCGFGGDQRHADLASCLQFYENNPQQQACFNMHLDSAIDGTAAACNGEPSAFCFNIHCPHATGIDYCM